MFHTFNVDADPPKAQSTTPTTATTTTSTTAATTPDTEAPRKRQKVSKACDRCRLFRVRCGEKPCAQCQASKVRCVTSSDSSGDQKFKLDVATTA